MLAEEHITDVLVEIQEFFAHPNAYRSVIILGTSLIAAYWFSRLLALGITKLAQAVAIRSDNESDLDRHLRLRQIETYLSITLAVVQASVVAVVGYIAWRSFSPIASSSAAAIGAGAFFVVFAGQTLGMLLRDITAGGIMIAEKWFNVGDYVKIEPFMDVSGVVEKFTLRSTCVRSLSGEVIWVHNQHILAAHVTHGGLRTIAVDIFVREKAQGAKIVNSVISTIPIGSTMLAEPPLITDTEKWGENLWRITVIGQTPPGREWLIERYFVNSLKEVDEGKEHSERIIVHEPIARYADSKADLRFKRAVRISKRK